MLLIATISKFITFVQRIYATILLLLAPPFCVRCKKWLKQRHPFCVVCERHIRPIVSATIYLTEKHDVKVYAISQYVEPLKSLVLAKARSDAIASKQLGELIINRRIAQLTELIRFLKTDNTVKQLQDQFYKKAQNPLEK